MRVMRIHIELNRIGREMKKSKKRNRAKENKNHSDSYYLFASENRMNFACRPRFSGAHFAIGNEQESHVK